jgi:hypothetical protein
VKQAWRTSAFDRAGAQPKYISAKSRALDIIDRKVITSNEQFAKDIKASASVSYSGWGVQAQASFSMSHSKAFTKDSVLIVASRKITNGFDGWASEPKLTP